MNPDPLRPPETDLERIVWRATPAELDRLRSVEAHRIRAARLAGVALMGGSAAIVIVAVLLVWRWLV